MTKKSKSQTFEEAIEELEEITRALEGGRLSLDESITAYERGMELKKVCQEMLDRAEKKLEFLHKKENGSLERKSFDSDAEKEIVQSSLFVEDEDDE